MKRISTVLRTPSPGGSTASKLATVGATKTAESSGLSPFGSNELNRDACQRPLKTKNYLGNEYNTLENKALSLR